MKRYLSITLFFFLISHSAYCEYRVYQYYVRPKIKNITIVASELVTSTLDPIAYVAYHGGQDSVEVNLLRSWQCMGNTSKAQICTISEGRELTEVAVLGVKP